MVDGVDNLRAMSHDIDHIIRSRRTHKQFSAVEISRAEIEEILELGSWAPNHRQAEPWRCYIMERDGIKKLDTFFEDHPEIASWPQAGKEKKLKKLREVYLPQLSAIIHVTSASSSSELKDRENYAASAAAIQNMLLAATARGYATFWNSSASMRHPLTQEWLGVDCEKEHFVGSLWIGGTDKQPTPPPRRSTQEFSRWIS